ncbi:MAG: stage II sporulation protein M [Crocinitomicaceae bacterium]|nr:stage II sporulation protein M [Crocinitomicaceae bacterium]
MKETKFIDKNKDKWSQFERTYSDTQNKPEELSQLYIDITEDLGYAQTFYKHRSVKVYLNQLAQKVFSGVHKHGGGEIWRRMYHVVTVSLPIEIYKSRKNLLIALISFLVYAFIGVVSTHYNPDFPRIIMGDFYVDMTLQNIEKGNPLAVYEGQEQLSMFINITTNNLKVALLTFFAGFFASIGTHILLFSNGVMLGAFQYFFKLKGLLVTSFLGIWIHGAFEISTIVLAGGAGITMGNGWLFPKTFTRLQSFKIASIRGMKIMLSLIPFIIVAGFLESFVTRNYQTLPEWSKWGIIYFSFALIIFYYIVYPFYIARKYPELADQEDLVENGKTPQKIVFYKIRSIGEIMRDAFEVYWQFSKKFLLILFTLIFPLALIVVYFQGLSHVDRMLVQHWYDWYALTQLMFGFGLYNGWDLLAGFAWSILITLSFGAVFWSVTTKDEGVNYRDFFNYLKKRFFKMYVALSLFYWLFFFIPIEFKVVLLFILPFLTINTAVIGMEKGELSLKKAFSYGKKSYVNSLSILLLYSLIVCVAIQPIALVFSVQENWSGEPMMVDLLDMITDFLNRALILFTDDYMYYSNFFRQFVYLLFLFIMLPVFVILTILIYCDIVEKHELIGLKEQFQFFGKQKNKNKK